MLILFLEIIGLTGGRPPGCWIDEFHESEQAPQKPAAGPDKENEQAKVSTAR